MIRLGAHPVRDLCHGHRRRLRKQFREQASVFWIEMLNEYERDTSVCTEVLEEFRKCFQPSRGSSKSSYRAQRLLRRCRLGRGGGLRRRLFSFRTGTLLTFLLGHGLYKANSIVACESWVYCAESGGLS